jgi:transcription elongation factor Elf1
MILVQFECPFCNAEVTIKAEDLSAEKIIKCNCGQLIPAGVLYDNKPTSN